MRNSDTINEANPVTSITNVGLMKIYVLKSLTSPKITKRVRVSDYIMDSKSMIFLTLSLQHFDLVFDFSYPLL